jgi:hypothetical protein
MENISLANIKSALDAIERETRVIRSDLLAPDAVVIVSGALMRNLTGLQMEPFDPDAYDEQGNPLPYDHRLVPKGHEPSFLLKPGDWLFWHDRVRLNNDLIALFGTKPKPLKMTRYSTGFRINPRFRNILFNISA